MKNRQQTLMKSNCFIKKSIYLLFLIGRCQRFSKQSISMRPKFDFADIAVIAFKALHEDSEKTETYTYIVIVTAWAEISESWTFSLNKKNATSQKC